MTSFLCYIPLVRLVSLFLLLAIPLAMLADPPNPPPPTVWRIDNRAPNDIFENGFSAWGDNLNILDHLPGTSTNTEGYPWTAFISTTGSRNVAINTIAHEMFGHRPSRTLWLYEIIPGSNFYNAQNTLDYIADNPAVTPRTQQVAAELIPTSIYQQEWFATKNINNNRVRSAIPLTSRIENGEIKILEGDPIINPDPASAPTASASPDPYRYIPPGTEQRKIKRRISQIKRSLTNGIFTQFCLNRQGPDPTSAECSREGYCTGCSGEPWIFLTPPTGAHYILLHSP